MKRYVFAILVLFAHVICYSQMRTSITTPSALSSRLPGYSQVTTIATQNFAYTPPTPPNDPTPVDGDTTTEHSTLYDYASIISTNLTTSSGNVTTTSAGKVWTLKISVPNAANVGFVFNQFNLSASAEMFIYNDEKTILKDSITKAKYANNSIVTVGSVPTGGLTIYIIERGNSGAFQSTVSINKIIAGYQPVSDVGNIGGVLAKASVNCDPSIQCQAAKLPQARAVAIVYCNGTQYTGTLVNNELNNGRAYFLTAFHCIDKNGDRIIQASESSILSEAFFRFQFWRTACNSTTTNPFVVDFQGATLVRSDPSSDVALLELTDAPGIGDGVTYAAWNRTSSVPSNTGCFIIHHPQGYDMRISLSKTVNRATFNNNFYIVHYSSGTTDHGSSGSPLFNSSNEVVGQLKGGWSNCNYTDFSDRYGRFDNSWGVLQSALSPTQNMTLTSTLATSTLAIAGPTSLSCSGPSQFSVPNFYGCSFNWSPGSGLTITSGQGTSTVTVTGSGSGGTATLNLLIIDSKGNNRYLSLSKSITLSSGLPSAPTITSVSVAPYPNSQIDVNFTPSSPSNVTSYAFFVDGDIVKSSTGTPSSPTTLNGGGLGSHTVSLRLTNACGSVSSNSYSYTRTTFRKLYTVSPNPAHNHVTVTSKSEDKRTLSDIKTIKLYNNLGTLRKLWSFGNGTKQANLNISDIETGNYYLEIIDGIITEKQNLIIGVN